MVPANAVAMPVSADESGDMLFDAKAFQHALELAKTISQSSLIPSHLRGQVPDILLALYMARTMGENPLVVLQSIHIISGRAGWSAQYLIARANGSGRFRGPIRWREEGEGESLAVTAYATLAETGEDVEYTVTMQMAHAEGWTRRNPKYRTMPNLMLRYRSATLLVRLFCPDVLMGLHERYELIDSDREARNARPMPALPPEASVPLPLSRPRAEAQGERAEAQSARSKPEIAVEVPKAKRGKARPAEMPAMPEPQVSENTPPEAKVSPEVAPEIEASEVEALVAEVPVAEAPAAEAPAAEVQPEQAPAPKEGAEDPEDRPAVLARLAKLREEYPDLVRSEARKMGLRSPAKSDVTRLRELITVVEARVEATLAELSATVEDPEELHAAIADARIAVEEGLGLDAVVEAAQAAGLPVGPEGPVLDGAPDPMLVRFLDELRSRRRIWGVPPIRVVPTE